MTLVRARCLPPPYNTSSYWTSNPVWVCFCSPLESSVPQVSSARNPLPTPPAEQSFLLSCFQSQHSRDMRIHAAQDRYSLSPVNVPVGIWLCIWEWGNNPVVFVSLWQCKRVPWLWHRDSAFPLMVQSDSSSRSLSRLCTTLRLVWVHNLIYLYPFFKFDAIYQKAGLVNVVC